MDNVKDVLFTIGMVLWIILLFLGIICCAAEIMLAVIT